MNIIYFEDLFNSIAIRLINLYFTELDSINSLSLNNKDCRTYLVYFIIDQILQTTAKDSVLYVNRYFNKQESELWTYLDRDKTVNYIIRTCRTLSKKLPFPILIDDSDIDYRLSTNGELAEFLSRIDAIYSDCSDRDISIKPFKTYCKNKGFTSLINKYYSLDNKGSDLLISKYLR